MYNVQEKQELLRQRENQSNLLALLQEGQNLLQVHNQMLLLVLIRDVGVLLILAQKVRDVGVQRVMLQ